MSHLDTDTYAADLASFVVASPSSYHAVSEIARQLRAAGFLELTETDEWPSDAGARFVVRDGAIVAWRQPVGASATTGFRILGAHTDSPSFKLKPTPDSLSEGCLQVAVEVYGGPLLSSWLDRELELAGRIVTRDGAVRLVRTGPLLRITQLAIHLDREQNTSLTLDKQRHVHPVWGVGDKPGDILELVAGVDASQIAGHDIMAVPTESAARFGSGGMLFASARLDNLSSVFAGLRGLLAASGASWDDDTGEAVQGLSVRLSAAAPGVDPMIPVFAAFDHEEIGSGSRSGASGPLLEDVLARVSAGLGATDNEWRRAVAASWLVSADTGHATHPNYPEKHDPLTRPQLGRGLLLKLNANQRYATDAVTSAMWAGVCERAGVAVQPFVSHNQVGCGSTIGPLTATRLGLRTVDVGVPLLSMHSARELAHVTDLVALATAVAEYFRG
ncbi:MAG: M18 family aminopeptidase [Candidatus Lumbricidophila eiseniae]|uniref:M18 family aminopeptidase n=1 Tax=Candidatus Lumbricidiphila eiseniae TaxID=1969409 RepID=A0A2A6FPI4_9MICO|nr:MAG: M18 family aminopeptidase [Candidatus Lumbricidophila eiseniae]